MENIREFVNSLTTSLINLDTGLLIDWSYLTQSRPDSFAFSGLLTLLAIVMFISAAVLFVLLRKKSIEVKGRRKIILKKIIKANFVVSILWLVFIVFRFQGIVFLSMRLWQLLFLMVVFLGNIVGLILYLKTDKIVDTERVVNKGVSNYQDYLPKRNKKRKR